MKPILNFFAISLASSLAVGTARADFEVSASLSVHAAGDFYAPLAPSGEWLEVGTYGRCWRPTSVAVEWRPYCYGHWVWTDCGWYWASDEPWAWACYHYGWWEYDPIYSWVWVPGIEWAPAWVSWRVGGGYIGWAPLPPRGVTVAVGGPQFVFVESSHFQDSHRPSTVIVNNTTIIAKTTVINNVKRDTRTIGSAGAQKVWVNAGPGLASIQTATGRKTKTVPIQEAARQTPMPAAVARNKPPSESNKKAEPSFATTEQPKFAPEQKPPSAARPIPPEKAAPAQIQRQQERPSAPTPESPKPTPERKATPGENRGQPAEAPPATKGREPGRQSVARPPERAPAAGRSSEQMPPEKASKPPRAADEGRGHEKESEGHGKDKP